MIYAFLCGGASTLAIVAGVIFLRYWRDTRDRFFAIWSISLGLMATQWGLSAFTGGWEKSPAVYLIRLGAFLLIIAAIVDKNRGSGGSRRRDDAESADLVPRSKSAGRARMTVVRASPARRAGSRSDRSSLP